MKPTYEEHKGHRIEMQDREGKPELLIDKRLMRYRQLANGSYFLREYAYDWSDNLMDLARKYIDHQRKATKVRPERQTEKGGK